MKYSMLVAGLVAALCAGSAAAQDISYEVNLKASVEGACSFADGPFPANGNFTNVSATGATFTVDIDPTEGRVTEQHSDTLDFAEALCNTASTVTIERSGLAHVSATPANGLVAHIPYAAEVRWVGDLIAALETGNTHSVTAEGVSPRSGILSLTITVPDGIGLVAGEYQDTLTLSVSPAS